MATNSIQGDLVGLYISTVTSSPVDADFKEVVCAENTGLDGSRDVNTKRTKCGVIKGYGPAAFTITGSGAFNHTPGSSKVSANAMLGYLQNETPLVVRLEYATDTALYYRSAEGQVTKFTESANSGDPLSFDFTIDLSGTLDLTA